MRDSLFRQFHKRLHPESGCQSNSGERSLRTVQSWSEVYLRNTREKTKVLPRWCTAGSSVSPFLNVTATRSEAQKQPVLKCGGRRYAKRSLFPSLHAEPKQKRKKKGIMPSDDRQCACRHIRKAVRGHRMDALSPRNLRNPIASCVRRIRCLSSKP